MQPVFAHLLLCFIALFAGSVGYAVCRVILLYKPLTQLALVVVAVFFGLNLIFAGILIFIYIPVFLLVACGAYFVSASRGMKRTRAEIVKCCVALLMGAALSYGVKDLLLSIFSSHPQFSFADFATELNLLAFFAPILVAFLVWLWQRATGTLPKVEKMG
ncbi:MAG: hypothetical protein KY445_03130 [Armatimonadetes bacterium]|nr:hypothetical protein [Armatimonadota bacterium]